MAIEIIDVGSSPNDGQGDPIRTAYVKCNNNFVELYTRQQDPPLALTGNVGDVAGMYAFDQNYWYYCFQDYAAGNGNVDIWGQLSSDTPSQIAVNNTSITAGNTVITVAVAGTANVMQFLANGVVMSNSTVSGTADFTGNITSAHILPSANIQYDLGAPNAQWRSLYLSGNTIYLGTAEITANATAVTLTSGSGASFSVSGNSSSGNLQADNLTANVVTANLFVGDGSALTNITAFANVAVTQIANGTTVLSVSDINGDVTAQIAGVANVMVLGSQGISTSQSLSVANALSVSGNTVLAGVSVGNLSVSGTALVSGAMISSSVSTGPITTTGNISTTGNFAAASGAFTGNLSAGNIATTGHIDTRDLAATGNITVSGFNTVAGLLTASSANITDTTDASSTASGALRVRGGIGVGGTVYATNITVTGTANIQNLPATSITSGTLASARLSGAYTGITALGTLTSVSITGNATAGNLLTGGLVTATGNVTGGNITTGGRISATGNIVTNAFFIGDGSQLTNVAATTGTRIVNGTSEINIGASNGNANITIGGTGNVVIISNSGTAISGTLSATGNATVGNLSATNIAGTLTTTSQTNITAVGTLGSLSVTGNVTGGNVITAGVITATGNVSGGNVITAGLVSLSSITKTGANGVGNIGSSTSVFNTVFAKATSAQYADLAEKYTADADYEPGTVVCYGGSAEVTASNAIADHRAAGVISTNPSYIMNSALQAPYVAMVALQGRVPCRVLGPVQKGDLLVSGIDGRAMSQNQARAGTIIGKSLENFDGEFGVIEISVGRA